MYLSESLLYFLYLRYLLPHHSLSAVSVSWVFSCAVLSVVSVLLSSEDVLLLSAEHPAPVNARVSERAVVKINFFLIKYILSFLILSQSIL